MGKKRSGGTRRREWWESVITPMRRRRYHQDEPDDFEELTMRYEKVGRLKPDELNNSIRVIIDGAGDIEILTRERMEMMVSGLEPVMKSSDVGIELLVGEEMIRVLGWQVKGMMEKWPRKKAGVWMEL